MPEWAIWTLYAVFALAFGGICITVYEVLINFVRCV